MSVAKAVGESLSEKPNVSYCKRLAELQFPDKVWIEGAPYTEETLAVELGRNAELLQRLVELCFLQDKKAANNADLLDASMAAQVVQKLFPKALRFGGRIFEDDPAEKTDGKTGKEKLFEALIKDPKLQQFVAARRYYMPSKWLVEQERIARKGSDEWCGDIYEEVAREGLTGVCFSGGGIRSATFNLGVVQGLAQLGMLPHIDYLSSVSGGGYIHEFLAGWILRNGNRRSVVRELIPQSEPGCLPRAPETIQWLKQYASYLTPARGTFSTDTWTMLAIWFRNAVLNQIPIVATFGVGLFLLHLLAPRTIHDDLSVRGLKDSAALWWVTGLVLLAFASRSLVKLWKNLHLQEQRASAKESHSAKGSHSTDEAREAPVAADTARSAKELLTNGGVVKGIILPWLSCSVWLTYWVSVGPGHESGWFSVPVVIAGCLMLLLTQVVIFEGGALGAHKYYNDEKVSSWAWFWFAMAGLLTTAIAFGVGWGFVWADASFAPWLAAKIGAVGVKAHDAQQLLKFSVSGVASSFNASLEGSLNGGGDAGLGLHIDPWRIQLMLLPGLLMSVPYVAIELTLGLLGRDYREMQREWLARLRAWSLLYALLWAGVVGLTLLGPYVGYWVAAFPTTGKWSAGIAFVVAHLTTVLGGASGKGDGKPTDNGILGYQLSDLLALIAAPFAMVSLLLVLSFGASVGVDALTYSLEKCPLNFGSEGMAFFIADGLCIVAAVLAGWLFGRRVDINEFSMHTFYKNRLSRCYLGAIVPGRREPDPFTGFDGRGSAEYEGRVLTLPPFVTDFLPKGYTRVSAPEDKPVYEGPFPIFCTTLNLTTGQDLATQERKGTSFAFTPLYSGYTVGWTDGENEKVSFNGYVPTDDYAYPKEKGKLRGGIHVDSAVAISGAAASPNMGYNTNPALAFLMTLFNVRLGWWISNPRRMDMWEAGKGRRATPKFALLSLFQELFGAVGDDAAYVNLSDGGHFENMGLYELVRRRCRYIVVCDAENDPNMEFGGMGMAITKCRADFGAEIDLDLRPLRKDPATGYTKTHCVVGTIHYPPPWAAVDGKADRRTKCGCLDGEEADPYTGVIVYLKSSLVGDEPADLLAYQLLSPVFPQDSTANQWFTESKFEAYRRLGHHVAMTTMKPALPPQDTAIQERDQVPTLFDRMYAIWYPRTPEMEKYLGDHLKQYEGILKELREHKELAGLEAVLNDARHFSETSLIAWNAPGGDPESMTYPAQFANSLLDFMYTVYTNLQLAFPDNRVSPHAEWWICLFRRWCRVTLVQDAWRSHAPMFSVEFRLFARRELRLPGVAGAIE
jgi:hypothetical protein